MAGLSGSGGGFSCVADMIAAGAKSSAACGAFAFVLVAHGAATDIAQGYGGRGAFDGSLGRKRPRHNAIAPTFGLDDQAHSLSPEMTMTRYSALMREGGACVYLFCG